MYGEGGKHHEELQHSAARDLRAAVLHTRPVFYFSSETIAEFDIDFARIVPVEVAEGDAVVEFDASAGNVDRVHRSGKAFTEILAQSHVEPGRPRQVVSGIRLAGKSIGEAEP